SESDLPGAARGVVGVDAAVRLVGQVAAERNRPRRQVVHAERVLIGRVAARAAAGSLLAVGVAQAADDADLRGRFPCRVDADDRVDAVALNRRWRLVDTVAGRERGLGAGVARQRSLERELAGWFVVPNHRTGQAGERRQ